MEYKLRQCNYKLNDEDNTAINQIFAIRGMSPNQIQEYLNLTDEVINNPQLLDNLVRGCQLLMHTISENKKIFIVVDDDVDGFTSAALLINFLYFLFPAYVQNNITYYLHSGKGHGIVLEDVPNDVALVIAPDSGSSQYEEHRALLNKGIEVLVLDHHEAPIVSNDAIIINNQLCDYPNKSLSGVGVVYKFCSYLDQLLNTNYSDKLLDLVAVGLIADVMDLRNYETKRLIDKGLENIQNPFLSNLIEKQAFVISKHGGLDPFSIGFYIAPMINAVIRVGSIKDKTILFESMLNYKAYNMIPSTKRGESGKEEMVVTQACRNCSNIKNKQTEIRDNNVALIEKFIYDNELLNNKILLICLDSYHQINKNLTGLVANILMSKYQRPVLLLNEVIEDGVKYFEGSGRGYDKSALTDFRGFLEECPWIEWAQGHAQAFGARIAANNVESFITYTNEKLADFDFSPFYQVDCIFQSNMIKPKDVIDIASYKNIWGQNLEEPIICIENINITPNRIDLLSRDKNPTLKITSSNGIEYMKFKSSIEEFESLKPEQGVITINIIGKCSVNTFGSTSTPQILIDDYEIVGRNQYFF